MKRILTTNNRNLFLPKNPIWALHCVVACLWFGVNCSFADTHPLGANPLPSNNKPIISSAFGSRISPFTGEHELHHGLDIPAKAGSPILATGKGIVTYSGFALGYGNLVEIDHGQGYVTRYGHAQTLLVKTGEQIEQLQRIATVGSTGRSTGPHLHFETLYEGKPFDPLVLLGNQYANLNNSTRNNDILIFTASKLKAPQQLTQYANGSPKLQALYTSSKVRASGQPYVIVRSLNQARTN